jgi:hypothetical protein
MGARQEQAQRDLIISYAGAWLGFQTQIDSNDNRSKRIKVDHYMASILSIMAMVLMREQNTDEGEPPVPGWLTTLQIQSRMTDFHKLSLKHFYTKLKIMKDWDLIEERSEVFEKEVGTKAGKAYRLSYRGKLWLSGAVSKSPEFLY